MIVHIDKLIRHLRSQIESADKVDSEFVYLTKREAEGCLELAEAQDVIQEMISAGSCVVHCKDCVFRGSETKCMLAAISARKGLPYYAVDDHGKWFCADGKRKG
jgi:hypothetical protein